MRERERERGRKSYGSGERVQMREKTTREEMAEAGSVTAQLNAIFFNICLFSLFTSSTRAIPDTAPIRQCVVETLTPTREADNTVEAVAIWAAKPREKVSLVIFSPTVAITL